jgi:hypothetical protein
MQRTPVNAINPKRKLEMDEDVENNSISEANSQNICELSTSKRLNSSNSHNISSESSFSRKANLNKFGIERNTIFVSII